MCLQDIVSLQFLFVSAVSLTGAIQVCPNLDFKIYQNGYCYSFHTNEYTSNTLARQRCQEMTTTMGNVDLVSIHSADENKFINDQMKAKKYTNYWIGFDRKPGSEWSFLQHIRFDGSKLVPSDSTNFFTHACGSLNIQFVTNQYVRQMYYRSLWMCPLY